jgi:hypothetical protein
VPGRGGGDCRSPVDDSYGRGRSRRCDRNPSPRRTPRLLSPRCSQKSHERAQADQPVQSRVLKTSKCYKLGSFPYCCSFISDCSRGGKALCSRAGPTLASSITDRAPRSSSTGRPFLRRLTNSGMMRRVLRIRYGCRRFQLRSRTSLGLHSRMQSGLYTLRGTRPAQHLRPARRPSTRLHRAEVFCSSWRTLVPPHPICAE